MPRGSFSGFPFLPKTAEDDADMQGSMEDIPLPPGAPDAARHKAPPPAPSPGGEPPTAEAPETEKPKDDEPMGIDERFWY
jgi:hypothetical protein